MIRWLYNLRPAIFLRVCGLCIASAVLFGCQDASVPAAIVVSGNGHCTPASDLPAVKHMKKVPVVDTFMDDLGTLLFGERRDHKKDIDDYNSLYQTCVIGDDQTKVETPSK